MGKLWASVLSLSLKLLAFAHSAGSTDNRPLILLGPHLYDMPDERLPGTYNQQLKLRAQR